jgi:F-type H+-transporting ATPase subunit epsilon
MASRTEFSFVLVTPEKRLLEEPASALRFPLFDGQIGILPGRIPMVGRLGYGELRFTGSAGEQSYYIDGGFVQVTGSVVSVLTNRAIPADEVDPSEAEELLKDALALAATNDAEIASRERNQQRARRMLAMAKR